VPVRKFTDDQIFQALKKYVKNRWTLDQLAAELQINPCSAHSIVCRKTYKNVKRPRGVQRTLHLKRPAPGRKFTHEQIKEALQVFQKGGSVPKVAENLGCSYGTAWKLVNGWTYREVPRPAGLRWTLKQSERKEVYGERRR